MLVAVNALDSPPCIWVVVQAIWQFFVCCIFCSFNKYYSHTVLRNGLSVPDLYILERPFIFSSFSLLLYTSGRAGKIIQHACSDRSSAYYVRVSLSNSLLLNSLNSIMFAFVEQLEQSFQGTDIKCIVSLVRLSSIIQLSTGLKDNDFQYFGYPVVRYQSNMQASRLCFSNPEDGLQTVCEWEKAYSSFRMELI